MVRVEDANNRPVAGAVVTFTAPQSGPSGEFENDLSTSSMITGADGLAAAGAFHPNAIQGAYNIQVRVEFQGQTAAASIPQTNIEQRKGHFKMIAILAIAGAAVGAAIAAGSGNKTSTTTTTAPTITFGGAAVGAPNR